jgi:hypothetical protein
MDFIGVLENNGPELLWRDGLPKWKGAVKGFHNTRVANMCSLIEQAADAIPRLHVG